MKRLFAVFLFVSFFSPPAAYAEQSAYDESWFATDRWNGEYPNGFTVGKEVIVHGRRSLDLNSAKDQRCELEPFATYHPWNWERIKQDELLFRSFAKKILLTSTRDFTYSFYVEGEGVQKEMQIKKNDLITYLSYLSEGMFLVEYKGKQYVADQDLMDFVSGAHPPAEEHQWLRLKCLQGNQVWLNFSDLVGTEGILEPYIIEYGNAKDLPKN